MLRSIVVAAGVLLAVLAACVGATALGFGRAPLADRVLVTALDRLDHYRRVEATIDARGHIAEASCSDRAHSAMLVLNRTTLVDERGKHLVGRTSVRDQVDFDLAGCPGPLRRRLLRNLAGHAVIDVHQIAGGYELTFPQAHPAFALLVTREGVPYELSLEGRRMRGTSLIRYGVPA